MTTLHLFGIFLAGAVASFINVFAGGGSMITVPLMIFFGLPSAVANGTNRIAVFLQCAVGVENYRRKGLFDYKMGLLAGIPAVFGAVLGSMLAVNLPDRIFNKILAAVMLFMLIMIVRRKGKTARREESRAPAASSRLLTAAAFFFVGIYGGFIQIGVGFIIIGVLGAVTDFSLVRINSVKLLIVGIYIIFTIAVFTAEGKINWPAACALSAGNMLGVLPASSLAVKKGDRFAKIILAIAATVMAVKLILR